MGKNWIKKKKSTIFFLIQNSPSLLTRAGESERGERWLGGRMVCTGWGAFKAVLSGLVLQDKRSGKMILHNCFYFPTI